MSLLGALSLGASSLAANQTGLQVTGNNIANAGTDGYTRQTVHLTPSVSQPINNGQFIGTGVTVESIERQVNLALNEALRTSTSDQSGADTLNSLLGRIQSTFSVLNDNNLSDRLTSFFSSFNTLSNNPSDNAQRSVVIQNGISLASYLQTLRTSLSAIRDDVQSQISALAQQADSLAHSVADLNSQIAQAQANPQSANSLLDQRDAALTQLAQLIDIRTVDAGNGMVNVLVGNFPLVNGTSTRGVGTAQTADPTNTYSITNLTFADTGDLLGATGGKLGGLVNARDNFVIPAVGAVDSVAAGLITTINAIHSQGQGLTGFGNVTAATQVLDPTIPLNSATSSSGIAFPPTNGTFNLNIKDQVTGNVTTKQITVNLSGQGAQTTLNSLAASITASGGGVVTGTVNAAGNLVIASNNSNVTFSFGDDTSGVLASLGINTFFTGKNARDISVNTVIQNNTDFLATARRGADGQVDAQGNAKALATAGSAAVSVLSGKSIFDFYTNYIGDLASRAKNAADDATATSTIHDTLFAQQQAISGVSMDEEAINLTKYQRAFQGSARFITVVDQMMQTILGLLG